MNPRLVALLEILNINTRLLRNCLNGVSDEIARRPPNTETNSVAFLACHLVDARNYLAKLIGLEAESQLRASQNYLAVVEQKSEPPLDQILDAWQVVSELLKDRLPEIPDQQLDTKSPEEFPVDDSTLFGALVFLLHHESYHIGQIAMARKFFGAGAIRYGHRALLSQR
ncbi:MAG: DinB family protein [Acidobacteriota bacterium]